MAETGHVAVINADAIVGLDVRHTPIRLRPCLLGGLSAVAILAAVSLPVTINTASMTPAFSSALADNGNGNGDGQGRGNGNGKGRGDEYGGGNGSDGDNGDNGDSGGDDSGDDNGDPSSGNRAEELGGGNPGDFGDIDESEFADEMAGPASPPEEALATAAAPALPTIREIFALGDESVLSAEQEMLAIKNGWNLQN